MTKLIEAQKNSQRPIDPRPFAGNSRDIYIYIPLLFPRKGKRKKKKKRKKKGGKKKIKEYPSNQALEAATIPISVHFCDGISEKRFTQRDRTRGDGLAEISLENSTIAHLPALIRSPPMVL